MDILAAMTDVTPVAQGTGRCALVKKLDAIPDDTAGKADLVAAVQAPEAWPATRLAKVLAHLDLAVSMSTIRQHRAGTCPCRIRG